MEDPRITTGREEVLDLRGLRCPLPVLFTRRALGRLPPGASMVVRCTDPLAAIDIPHLLRETGDALLLVAPDGEGLRFLVRKRDPGDRIKCPELAFTPG